MTRHTLRTFLPLGLVALLGGCAMYGDDVGSYGRYNGSIGVGVGTGYGYGYGPGWYDGFYYPGSGLWAYDRGGKRHRWQGGGGRGDHREVHRGGYRSNGDQRGIRSGQPGPGVGAGVGAGQVQGQPRGEGWRGRHDNARPQQRAPDVIARPSRPAPQERAPSRPGREGRNAQERPD